MDLNVGDIIRIEDGRLAVVTVRKRYEASAHNDRWTDYHTEAHFLTRNLTVNKAGNKITFTTDDVLRGRFTKVGTAEVEWKVDAKKIKLDK
jgi:hypothetical protein